MRHTLHVIENTKVSGALKQHRKCMKLQLDFEDVGLTAETTVGGGETEALKYMPAFEADIRADFSELSPQLEPPEPEEPKELEVGEKR